LRVVRRVFLEFFASGVVASVALTRDTLTGRAGVEQGFVSPTPAYAFP
jgi:hypothetical protein